MTQMSVETMAAEKAILCVLFDEFSEPDEIRYKYVFNTAK